MDNQAVFADIEYIRKVVKTTHARVDSHSFHSVNWGLIVLIWYPLHNWLQDQGRYELMRGIGIAAIVIGVTLSWVLEWRLSRKPRLAGENTFILKQIVIIVYACIGAGCLLSALGPSLGFIDGERVPIVWGFVYANLAFMMGVVYTREYLVAGAAIFGGAILASIFPLSAGYILGPFMGIGLIVPGLMGERRVARLRAADGGG